MSDCPAVCSSPSPMPMTRRQEITNHSKAKSRNARKRGPTPGFPAKSNTLSRQLLPISQADLHSSRTTTEGCQDQLKDPPSGPEITRGFPGKCCARRARSDLGRAGLFEFVALCVPRFPLFLRLGPGFGCDPSWVAVLAEAPSSRSCPCQQPELTAVSRALHDWRQNARLQKMLGLKGDQALKR
jgi:hypothetical protein